MYKKWNLGDFFVFFQLEIFFFKNEPRSIFKLWECTQSIPHIKLVIIGSCLKKILARRQEKNLPVENLTDKQIMMTIFDAQFSTKTEVTELSGRGVGLDAVKFEVEKLGGTVDLESVEGQGTTFIFKLPLITGLAASTKALLPSTFNSTTKPLELETPDSPTKKVA